MRGGDEWHNPKWVLFLPFLGSFSVCFSREMNSGEYHAWGWCEGVVDEGVFHIDCPTCNWMNAEVQYLWEERNK